MEIKQDLRITKTYKALTTAFFELLAIKKFEEITVNEICEHALIRRATFYKHFGDKLEFFVFIVNEVQRDCLNQAILDPDEPFAYYRNIIQSMLTFLDRNEQLVNSVLGSSYFHLLLDIVNEQAVIDIKAKLVSDQKRGILLPASPDVIAQSFTGALIATTKWWLTQGKKISREQLTKELEQLLIIDIISR
ncbi:MAG: TetR/AcrR family transcriptional regulator [Culicoidibacterales bacterium]